MRYTLLLIASILFAFEISSPAFKNQNFIPKKYTCEGQNVSIPLILEGIPKNAKSLAIIMQDPDAPGGVFTHWVLYNISPQTKLIPQNLPKTSVTPLGYQGYNDFGKIGYGGPCPPPHQTHRYVITAIAINKKVKLPPNLTIRKFLAKIRDYVIDTATYVGLYKRSEK